MKKQSLFVFVLLITVCGYAQQVFTTFQNASLVVGQPNFLTQYTSYCDSITQSPSYCAISSKGMLAVAEQATGCVKIWFKIPTTNGSHADVVVGNPSFSSTSSAFTQSSIGGNCNGVAWSPDGNKLIASDFFGDRVLIWNSIPAVNGQPADVVVGQVNFTDNMPGTTASSLYQPTGVMVSPEGKLFVADRYNNRVLIWNSIPATNGTPANVVIGQPDFISSTGGYLANQMYRPWGMSCSPDGRLLIACDGANHVLVYDSVPVANGESATVVIGHPDFGISSSGTTDSTMYFPIGVSVSVDGTVAIAEYGNNRVLLFDSIPAENGAHASVVLGQSNFTSSMAFPPSGTADTNNFRSVYNVATDLNGRFFVVGRDMNRILVFGELPTDSADLGVTINVSSTALCDSSDVVYNISLYNSGPDTAKNIVATTAFPSGYSIDSIQVFNGSFNPVSGYWNIPALAPAEDAEIIINGLVDPGMAGQTITTYASIINSSAIDTNLSNNGTSADATVLITPRPDDPVVTGAEICSGDSASLTASGPGTMYWFANSNDVVPLDTGSVYITEILTEAAIFYVEANNGCPSFNRIPANVAVNPVYNESATASVCSGDSYTFPDGSIADAITEDTIQISNLLSINGCDSIIVTSVTVNPVFNIAESVSVCSGDNYTFPDGSTLENITEDTMQISSFLSAEGCDSLIVTSLSVNPVYNIPASASVCFGDSYTFPDGTEENNITSPVSHESLLMSIMGCDSVITTNLTVTVVDVTVTQNGTLLTAASDGLDYQWVDCNDNHSLLDGETGQSYTATESGNYAVIITDAGCSDTSDCYSVVIDAVNLLSESDILIYPNPTRDNIILDFNQEYNRVDIEVLNIHGQYILKNSYSGVIGTIELELKDYENGIYFLRITVDNRTSLYRISKE